MSVSQSFRVYALFACTASFVFVSQLAYAQTPPIQVQEHGSSDVVFPDAEELTTEDGAVDKNMDEVAKDGADNKGFTEVIQSVSGPSASTEAPDDFFDAEDLVPQGEMQKKGPVKVDPSTQPASKMIIVKKNYEANTQRARLVSAERAMALGRFDSSLQLYDDLYTESKKDARVLMGRAVVLQKVGRFEDAMDMYEALSKVEPDNVDAKVNMLGLLSTKYPSVALRRLLGLYETHKNHTGLVAQIAVAYAKAGDAQSALRYLGVAAGMEPHNANHLLNMAIIADRSGQSDEALTYYEHALEVDTIHGAGRSIPRESVYQRLAQMR